MAGGYIGIGRVSPDDLTALMQPRTYEASFNPDTGQKLDSPQQVMTPGYGQIGTMRGGESVTKNAAVTPVHPADAITQQIAPLPGGSRLMGRKKRAAAGGSVLFGQHNLAAMGPAFFSMANQFRGNY